MKRFVQFIAGAICPDCKSKDTIALNPTNDEIYCVKCNFVEKRPDTNDIEISQLKRYYISRKILRFPLLYIYK